MEVKVSISFALNHILIQIYISWDSSLFNAFDLCPNTKPYCQQVKSWHLMLCLDNKSRDFQKKQITIGQ